MAAVLKMGDYFNTPRSAMGASRTVSTTPCDCTFITLVTMRRIYDGINCDTKMIRHSNHYRQIFMRSAIGHVHLLSNEISILHQLNQVNKINERSKQQ